MTAATSNPLPLALDQILHGSDKSTNPNVILLDYRDLETFSVLWLHGLESGEVTIGGQEIDLTDPSRQYLIIGNDPPDGILNTKIPALSGINFRSHFTATSWLAAWKVKFSPTDEEKKENGAKEGLAKIAVIDPREARFASGTARALQTILGARDAEGNTLVPGASVLNAPSLEAICQWLSPPNADHRTVDKDAPHLRELLKSTIWNELTSKSEKHHAISNILGPMILSGKGIDENCFKSATAEGNEDFKKQQMISSDRVSLLLRNLLSACGLVSWEDKKPYDEIHQPSETGQGLNILLLDDQAEQGWEHWVKECLPGAAGTIEVAVDPTGLVAAITKALSDNDGNLVHKDARFRLDLPGLDAATHPVLLLDLRLFSGNDEAERNFLRNELLHLVNHFTDKLDLAWPGFRSNDKKRDKAFRDAKAAVLRRNLKVDSPQHHEVLTWLPRVVALADMSLPIILFSSTGRRDLVEPFKAYGNIVTSFEKPRLNDLEESSNAGFSIRTTTLNSLQDAVKKARRWLEGRSAGIMILKDVDLDPLKNIRIDFADKKHFEIYHDESGEAEKSYFRVISLLAGFASYKNADQYDRTFPIRFFGEGCEDKRASDGDEKGRWATYWSQIKTNAPALLLASCVRDIDTQNAGAPDSLFDANGLDNINWDLLSLMWENMLADVLPALLKDRKADEEVTLSIFGATRFRPVLLKVGNATDAVTESNLLLAAMRDRWGMDLLWDCRVVDEKNDMASYPDKQLGELGVNQNYGNRGTQFKFLWRSLKPDSFWKLVADVLFARSDCPRFQQISKAIDCAKGEMLVYGATSRSFSTVSSLHYMADLCGNLIDVDLKNETVTCTSEPFENPQRRASMAFRRRLVLILNANRLLDTGDCDAEAIACFHRLNHDHPPDLAYLALAERLRERLPVLHGRDMTRLEDFLSQPPAWVERSRLAVSERVPITNRNVVPENSGERDRTMGLSNEEFAAKCRRWNTRRYKNEETYKAERAKWHTKTQEGFRVRISKKLSIIVFADLDQIEKSALPEEFGPPGKTFFPKGELLGRDWSPDE